MSTNQALFPIASMARVLGVSTAGYYAWHNRPPSTHAQVDAALLKQVRTVHASSRQIYGAPRIHAQLRADGARHGRKRIARLMREAGLVGACHRQGGPITTQRDKEARPAPDLVDRDFTAQARNRLPAVRAGWPTSPRYCRPIQAVCARAAKRVTRVLARGVPASQCTTREAFSAAAVQTCCNPVLARPM